MRDGVVEVAGQLLPLAGRISSRVRTWDLAQTRISAPIATGSIRAPTPITIEEPLES